MTTTWRKPISCLTGASLLAGLIYYEYYHIAAEKHFFHSSCKCYRLVILYIEFGKTMISKMLVYYYCNTATFSSNINDCMLSRTIILGLKNENAANRLTFSGCSNLN